MVEAKQIAAQKGCTVSALVNEAIHEKIRAANHPTQRESPFRVLTYGGDSLADDLLPQTIAEMVAEDDLRQYGET